MPGNTITNQLWFTFSFYCVLGIGIVRVTTVFPTVEFLLYGCSKLVQFEGSMNNTVMNTTKGFAVQLFPESKWNFSLEENRSLRKIGIELNLLKLSRFSRWLFRRLPIRTGFAGTVPIFSPCPSVPAGFLIVMAFNICGNILKLVNNTMKLQK